MADFFLFRRLHSVKVMEKVCKILRSHSKVETVERILLVVGKVAGAVEFMLAWPAVRIQRTRNRGFFDGSPGLSVPLFQTL